MSTPSTSEKKDRSRKRISYIDENAPKRPRSAYVLFISARSRELESNDKGEVVQQRRLVAELAKDWKSLTEEQKKPYLEEAAIEQEKYQKAVEEYKKTEAYSQFQVRKEVLLKKRKQELQKRRGGVHSSDNEEEVKDEVLNASDIPIFSKEFLAYNKAQESKCKKLRRQVSALQEETNLLKADIAKLSERVELLNEQRRETTQWATKMKTRWAKLLIDALAYVSVDGEYPTVKNIDTYMQKLKKLVAENPNGKDLIAVRMALAEVNFV